MTAIELPRGSHYAAMWGIPDKYAGMTNSMLHRSRAFVELTGTEITILTYEHLDDYDAVRTSLRERGGTIEGMHVRNIWEDLRAWDDDQLKQAADTFEPDTDVLFDPLGPRGDHTSPLCHVLVDDGGTQTDYLRADGTLLVLDRRWIAGARRGLTLCDTSGAPLGTWRSIWSLYRLWLDSLPRDPVAWIISDSKTSANHLVDYRRDDVVTMHVVHGSHLEPGTGRPMGTLSVARRRVMNRLDHWDAVLFLTQQQLDEVDALLGPGTNRYVIAHGRYVPPKRPRRLRSRYRGIALTSLDKRKQIDHAIKAMNRIGRVRYRRVKLDVWGEGAQHDPLQALIERRKAPVTLRGYSPSAPQRFERSSFSLLTSINEAFGLVLVESMGRGCIPISYDMPYGPSEIITHGVDGFLVPADDINELARTIREFVGSSASEIARMRKAAYERATQFDDEHVTQRWVEVMTMALEAKQKDRT